MNGAATDKRVVGYAWRWWSFQRRWRRGAIGIRQLRSFGGKDAITDQNRSGIRVSPIAPAPNRANAQLIWKCMEDGLNVGYLYGKYLTGGTRIQYRFDTAPAGGVRVWDVATNHVGAFMPMNAVAAVTTAAMASSQSLARMDTLGKP